MKSGVRKILFFVLLLGVTYFGYRYMIKPANARLAEQQKRVTQKSEKLAQIKKATASIDDISTKLEQLKHAIDILESKLPHTNQIHKVLEQVTVIAQKQGLKPQTISTLDQKPNNGYVEQPLKMELSGDFPSFYSFLLELEKLPRIMKVRQLSLNKNSDHDGQIAANFVISIFFQEKG